MKVPLRPAACIALIGLAALSAGCNGGHAVLPAAVAPQPAAANAAMDSERVAGLLTLKGSEVDAWWALLDDSGKLWRLEPADAAQADLFRQWQNHRVEIDGLRAGIMLLTPMLKVKRAQLLR